MLKKTIKFLSFSVLTIIMILLINTCINKRTIIAVAEEVSYDMTDLTSFSLDKILLTDDYYINAALKEIEYLISFDSNKLLAGFRETAGLDTKGATRYSGWENSLIGGHTLGHYLTACVQAYQSANTSDAHRELLLQKITEIIDGLNECQNAIKTGYIFGAKIIDKNNIELQFDNVENNLTDIMKQAWVPWYTMHKTIAGILSVAQMPQKEAKKVSDKALKIASGLGDWTYNRLNTWNAATKSRVLNIEYGGMNDCLYDLYRLTKKEEHAIAAHTFDQDSLFQRVHNAKQGQNVLNNLHANTTIPKFLGALNRYITYQNDSEVDADIYMEYAKAFWDMVVMNHTYITGGNSEWERFGQDNILDAERTNCNNETCNVYNMLKLTKKLYMLTGDVKYADYYENTFINSIMSSQNPETGMTTYFQPMATGYFKVFGTEYTKFWCCTGTGMENFTKLGESIYYNNANMLVVYQYISSQVNWDAKGVQLIQESKLPESDIVKFIVKTTSGKDVDMTIAFRLPDWLASDVLISINDKSYNYKAEQGYAYVKGPFSDNTKISIKLPMEIKAYPLPDSANVYGFKYGPVVLSALLGSQDMSKSTTGMDVTIPLAKKIDSKYTSTENDTIIVPTLTVEEFIDNINSYMVRDNGSNELVFKLQNANTDLSFVTHYSQYKERYGIYWRLITEFSMNDPMQVISQKESARMEAFRLDTIQVGYGQYENDELHNLTQYGTGSTGNTAVGTSRYANEGGAFSYRLLVDTNKGTNLLATLNAEDNGKTLQISIGDTVVYEQVLYSDLKTGMYDIIIPLPLELLSSNAEKVTIDNKELKAITFKVEGIDGRASARLCEFLYSVRAYDTECELETLSVDTGTLSFSKSRNKFTLKVSPDTKEVNINLGIESEYGYAAVNGEAVPVDKPYRLELTKPYTGILINVYAEDHKTSKEYRFVVLKDEDIVRENVDKAVVYFVDCGDHDPSTVSEGDFFGSHNSVTEQLYDCDSLTGYYWGLIDDANDQYNGASISKGLYTANTWCFEQNSRTDGLSRTDTNRYTKNQYESSIDRHIDYGFELENGTYLIEMGFANPWGCSNKPSVYADLGTGNQELIVDSLDLSKSTEISKEITVSGNKLLLHTVSQDKAINITYIRITAIKLDVAEDDSLVIDKYVSGEMSIKNESPAISQAVKPVTNDTIDSDEATMTDGTADKLTNKKGGAIAAVILSTAILSGLFIAIYYYKKKKS